MSINSEIVLIDSDDDDIPIERESSPHPNKVQRTTDDITTSFLTYTASTMQELKKKEEEANGDTQQEIIEPQQVDTKKSPSPSSSISSLDHLDSDLEEVSFGDNISPPSELGEEYINKESSSLARSYLKDNGSMKFLDKYLPTTLSSDELCNLIKLLGYRPRMYKIENEEERLMYLIKYLQRAMNKVLIMRVRLPNFNTIDHFIEKLQTSQNIMVLTGAGISTSLGIPDFRSSKGFYARLQHLGLEDPQEVFDLSYFREDPTIFYSIAHMIVPPEHAFTPLHLFIRLLQDKGKLLRNYTQNIDNLESNVGIDKEKLIQCHGSFATLSCITCGFQVPGETIFPEIKLQELPICPWCKLKRERLEEDMQSSFGVMKPDITFFGELLPERFHQTIKKDIEECDLLICIGTSLKVAPVSNIVNLVPDTVPQILINKDLVGHCEFDLSLLGYCDQLISYICDKLGWEINHKDYQKIVNNDLQCTTVEADVGIYEINDKDYRESSAV